MMAGAVTCSIMTSRVRERDQNILRFVCAAAADHETALILRPDGVGCQTLLQTFALV